MSALTFRRIKRDDETRGFCDNGCRSEYSTGMDIGRKFANWQVFGLGRPAGQVCDSCKATLTKEYDRARGPVEDHRASVPKALAA